MPEGPSILILHEEIKKFTNQKVIEISGSAKIDKDRFINQKIIGFKTFGKQTLICFKDAAIRIHLLMFGTYLINDSKSTPLKIGLRFNKGELNFYTCAVTVVEGNLNDRYDWSADIMNDKWSAKNAKEKLDEFPKAMICDVLLDQNIFAGLGNIIKNEILYRTKIHPESIVGKLPEKKIKTLIKEARVYSFEFLEWKKENTLTAHWLAHEKKICKRCNLPLIKKHTGKNKRRSYFCTNCQELYK